MKCVESIACIISYMTNFSHSFFEASVSIGALLKKYTMTDILSAGKKKKELLPALMSGLRNIKWCEVSNVCTLQVGLQAN